MTTSEADLQRMLAEAYRLPTGPNRFAALDTVFRHADAAGHARFAFGARLNALHEFHHGGDYTRAFMAFSWCVSALDRQPELVASHQMHTLLWRYKWIVWELPQFPDIPLERATAVLDDMERRYREGNHSLHAVYQHRGLVAHHLGDMDAADHWYDLMRTARRDGLSDCGACVPSSLVQHDVAMGRYERAVQTGTPYTNGGCTEQPQWMLSELLPAYLHTGRLDAAADAHRRAYRIIRHDRHHLENIGLNVAFCALSGNESRALPIIEEHLSWLDRPSSPYAAMEFASAAALALRRLREIGHGDLVLRRRTDDGSRTWRSTVDEAHGELARRSRELAARFDARNGNTYQSGRIEARLAAGPVVASLPLTVLAGRPEPSSRRDRRVADLVSRIAELTGAGNERGAARARLSLAYELRNAGRWDDAVEIAEEALRGLDRVGLTGSAHSARYLLFQLYLRAGHRHGDGARALLDELVAAPDLPARVPAPPLLREEAAQAWLGPQALVQWRLAAAGHREAGDLPGERRTLRNALALVGRTRERLPAEDLAAMISRLDELAGPGAGTADDDPARTAYAVGTALAASGDLDGAVPRLDAALAAAGDPDSGSAIRLRRAGILLRLGRHDDAEADARRLVTGEDDEYNWDAAMLLVLALRAQDRRTEADRVMSEHRIEEWELDEFAPGVLDDPGADPDDDAQDDPQDDPEDG